MTVPSYVDISRLCTELCISEATADAWVRQGILPAPIQRGHKRLWKWRLVEEYMDHGKDGQVVQSPETAAERVRNGTKRALAETSRH